MNENDNNGCWKLVRYPNGEWTVRIATDAGLEVESKQRFASREQAVAYFQRFVAEHNIKLGETAH